MSGIKLNPKSFEWRGNTYFLIGKELNGPYWYLQKATFDCGWYWGLGYMCTFTNQVHPERSRDIEELTHFDYLFLNNQNRHGFDMFNDFFEATVLDKKETWKFLECVRSIYTLRDYSDLLYRSGSGYTENPCKNIIQNNEEYKRINEEVIPSLHNVIYSLLKGEGVDDK